MLEVKIYYHGTPPIGASAAIGNGFSNKASPTYSNQITWSLSQPYSAYEWWPCKQSLQDKIDSVFISVTTDTSNKKEWLLTFTKKNNHVDLSCFLDKNKFYYLPKKTEWLELIQNRVHYNVNTANYVYEHNSDNIFDVEFLQNIKFLKFDLTYKYSNYSNLKFEYEIIYFPL
jgi:hypothetical protein